MSAILIYNVHLINILCTMSNLSHRIKQLKNYTYNAGLKFGEVERKELIQVDILRFDPSGYLIEWGTYDAEGNGHKTMTHSPIDNTSFGPLKRGELITYLTCNRERHGYNSKCLNCELDNIGNVISFSVYSEHFPNDDDKSIIEKSYSIITREFEYYQ